MSFCKTTSIPPRDLNLHNLGKEPTLKQPSSWFTVPRQGSLLEKFSTTGSATGNRTRVSRLHVKRADHYTMAEEWENCSQILLCRSRNLKVYKSEDAQIQLSSFRVLKVILAKQNGSHWLY